MDVITNRARHANFARRAFGLEPCGNVHCFAMQIGAIWDGVADLDADAEADGAIRRLIGVVDWNFLLQFDGAAHSAVDAVEHDQQ